MGQPLFFDLPFRADRVVRTNAVIRGVSVITAGVTARGHDLDVDATTIQQMFESCQTKGQIPVKANHKAGVQDITGYISNFSISDGKLKGDWHILQSFPAKDQILETAERMPAGVGLSAAFVGPDKPVREGGRTKARCEEVLSIDYVTMPAANPSGLFSAVDTQPQPKPTTMPNANEPSLADLQAQIAALTERLTASEQTNQELMSAMNPPSLEDLAQMDEQQLAELGLTVEDVEQAVAEANAQGDEGEVEGGDAGEGQEAEAVGAGAGGADAGSSEGSTGLNARIENVVTYFEQKMAAEMAAGEKAEQTRIETAFSSLEKQIVELKAKNQALELSAKTGARVSKPAIELSAASGEFGKLVELSVKSGKTQGAAIKHVMATNPEAYQAHLVKKGVQS